MTGSPEAPIKRNIVQKVHEEFQELMQKRDELEGQIHELNIEKALREKELFQTKQKIEKLEQQVISKHLL